MFLMTRFTFLRRSLPAVAALVLGSVFTFSNVSAQSAAADPAMDRAHIEEVLKGLNRGRSVGQVAVAPDGKHLAWIQGDRESGTILVASLDDLRKTQRVTAAAKPDQYCRESEITWEPDAKGLA